jgi:hypothetical protein
MIRRNFLFIACMTFVLMACAPQAPSATPSSTVTPTLTPTPDICSRENLLPVVTDAHKLVREFDDINQVANLTPQSQLGDMVLKLQDVRRRAEDLIIPGCILNFKAAEVDYMNSVITYLKLFMAGGYNETLSGTIAVSQQKRVAYENLRLFILGITPSPSPSPTLGVGTSQPETPSLTPTNMTGNPQVATPTLVAITGNITVSNPTMLGRNLHDAPSLDAIVTAILLPGETAIALAKDGSAKWVLVKYQEKQLWVYADQVTLSASLDSLPVILSSPTPAP